MSSLSVTRCERSDNATFAAHAVFDSSVTVLEVVGPAPGNATPLILCHWPVSHCLHARTAGPVHTQPRGHAAEDGLAANLARTLLWDAVVWPWRDELQCSVRAACVVVSDIPCQHGAQVTFTDDE